MSKGPLIAVLVVLGYIGFEAYSVHRVGYRMEAPYIFDQFVSAYRAASVCRTPEAEQQQKFLRNLSSVTKRAEKAWAKTQTGASPDAVERTAATRRKAAEEEVDALIETRGCEDMEVWKLLRRFEIYAKLNLG